LGIARRSLKKLKTFAQHSPNGFLNKIHFLEAELCAADDKLEQALAKYESSIEYA